jgi:hypothetical protein
MKPEAFLTLLLFIVAGSATAQTPHYPYKDYDFSKINPNAIDQQELQQKIINEQARLDSLYALRMDSLQQLMNYVSADTTGGYTGGMLTLVYMPGDYQTLIKDLQSNGFNDVSEGAFGFGYGFTFKHKRFIHDFLFSYYWGGKMKSETNEVVKLSGGNIINYTFGFDIVNLRRLNLSPFIGLNHQMTSIRYQRNNSGGNTYSSLLDIPADVDEVDIEKHALRFSFGGELDYHIVHNKRAGGIILGFRYGMNKTIAEGSYKAEKRKINYDPEIDLKSSFAEFVIKFYSTRNRDLH